VSPLYFLPAIPIILIFAGVYFTFYAKRDQARDFVHNLFDETDRQEQMKKIRQQHYILKKRRKDQSPFIQRLDMDLDRANLLMKPNEFLMICLASAVVLFVILFLIKVWIGFAILGAGGGLFLPQLYLKCRIFFRMKKAAAQFSDVLDMMVSCFKSGYGFSKALQVVSENFNDPWSTELGKVVAEMNFGASQEDCLMALAKRIPNPDVALFVTAVMIQKETGGNLAELLSNLSHTIRERYKLLSKVGALSAQGKLSAIIIFCIPFGLAGVFTLLVPAMMSGFVHNPIGIALIVFACILQSIGGIVLKKIVTLEV